MRTLVVGDLHGYASHPAYLSFCEDTASEFGCDDDPVFIGDMADQHTLSRFPSDENAEGSTREFELTLEAIQRWYSKWPTGRVCIGNHDERILRIAKDAGAPSYMLKSFSEMWQVPGWRWRDHWISDGMLYIHGHEKTGAFPPIDPARNHALKSQHSTCLGHFHSKRGSGSARGAGGTLHWVNTGCGVDELHPHMSYGRGTALLPLLGCAVVIDGTPFSIPMRCEHRGDPYHRSRFGRKPR